MRYPIFIEPGTKDRAFGAIVPDLPGCFSAGDTLEEALVNAREAIAVWLESELDNGGTVPQPETVDSHYKNYKGWIPSLIEASLTGFVVVRVIPSHRGASGPRRVAPRQDRQRLDRPA